jgi:disulfide oxidoreductase YuzD
MANSWDIPNWLEAEVRRRDTICVYCRVPLKEHAQAKGSPSDKATWEHIDNDGLPVRENIALCCAACNASKGVKKLMDWLDSDYCKRRNINKNTVADIIQKYIARI